MLAGGVSGALATVPIPGLGMAGSAIIMGGVGNITGNLIRGDVSNFDDVVASFGMGAVAGGIGYGVGTILGPKIVSGLKSVADRYWSQLTRDAQKQIIKSMGGVSQKMVNQVYQEIKRGITENMYRQLVDKFGVDIVVAATVSAVGTEVKGK